MSRTIVNFFIDFALLLIVAVLAAVSVITQHVFPPGTSAKGWTLWGFSYDAWTRFEFVLLCVLLLAVLVHVMMHWTWVCGVVVTRLLRGRGKEVTRDDGLRTLYGVTTLIVILLSVGGVVAAAVLTIQSGAVS
ncbi:MAG: DUF4405 domain-containing protein [Planctomycetales bacterium]|nr:DUF4405 domain-containing protein [Planctomycetales bacterium]